MSTDLKTIIAANATQSDIIHAFAWCYLLEKMDEMDVDIITNNFEWSKSMSNVQEIHDLTTQEMSDLIVHVARVHGIESMFENNLPRGG